MRLTIDLDRIGNRRAKGLREFLLWFFPHRVVERVSPRERGRHFIVYHLDVPFEDVAQLRRWLGDDPRRLRIDRARHRHGVESQVLFAEKRGKLAKTVFDTRLSEVG